MIEAISMPYSSNKTDEIMSRYRPIAPKPELPSNSTTTNAAPSVPEKFRQSPYLRNIWSHLQARPTRTHRKRGRTSTTPLLRKQTPYMGLRSPSPSRNLSINAFGVHHQTPAGHYNNNSNNTNNNNNNNVVELPLFGNSKPIDLNVFVTDPTSTPTPVVLEEKDLLLQLQVPASATTSRCAKSTIISPRLVRPVGSFITIIGNITEDPRAQPVVKPPEDVEAVAEAETLPAIISDRSNKVRMVNSAYKELVGQPECRWLNSMCLGGGRISGEVMLDLSKSGSLPLSCNGFSGWGRIEWESEQKKQSVNAFCEVVKLECLAKDYLLFWRFHAREISQSASNV